MKKFGAVLAALGFAMAIGACGESEGENQSTNGGEEFTGTDSEVVEQALTNAFCEALFECYDSSPLSANLAAQYGRYGTVENCKANATIIEFVDDPEFQAALEGGRLVVDRTKASACGNDYKAAICAGEIVNSAPASCLEFLKGQTGEGDFCVNEFECAGGLECSYSFEEESACYGTCVPAEESENTCGEEVCTDGQFCDYEVNEETFDFVEFCSPTVGEDEECEWDEQCGEGLRCSPIREICVPLEGALEGESCIFAETICEPGTRCYLGDEPDLMGEMGEMLEGTCIELGDEGDNCVAEFDCKIDLTCIRGDEEEAIFGTCGVIEPQDNGTSCSLDEQCESGYCNWEEEVCAPQVGLGENCNSSSQCESGFCDWDEETLESVCMEGDGDDDYDQICIHPDDEA